VSTKTNHEVVEVVIGSEFALGHVVVALDVTVQSVNAESLQAVVELVSPGFLSNVAHEVVRPVIILNTVSQVVVIDGL